MFKRWTLWDVANYALILIFLDCCFFGLEDAVVPSFCVMVVGIISLSIIRRACGQLKTPQEIREEHCTKILRDCEEDSKMLHNLYEERKHAEAEEARRRAQESREAHEHEARLKTEAEEVLEKLRNENNNRTE